MRSFYSLLFMRSYLMCSFWCGLFNVLFGIHSFPCAFYYALFTYVVLFMHSFIALFSMHPFLCDFFYALLFMRSVAMRSFLHLCALFYAVNNIRINLCDKKSTFLLVVLNTGNTFHSKHGRVTFLFIDTEMLSCSVSDLIQSELLHNRHGWQWQGLRHGVWL